MMWVARRNEELMLTKLNVNSLACIRIKEGRESDVYIDNINQII